MLGGSSSVSSLSQPQQRLTDRKIADDLVHSRIGRKRLPQVHVTRLVQRQAAEQESWMANRPLVVVHHVRWLRPGPLVLDERVPERERLAHPAALGRGVGPQVVCSGREYPGERSHHVELKER